MQPGFPIVGGDVPGTNLVVRSNNSNVKGTVLLDEPSQAFGYNTGALQTIGGIGAQHNVSVGGAFVNMPYGYSVNNVMLPTALTGSGDSLAGSQGGIYTGTLNLVGVSAVSTSSGVATFTFVAQSAPPFIVGQFITVTGMTPTGYNGQFQVTACTTTTVSYVTPTTGSLTGYGWISQSWGNTITTPMITIGAPTLPNGSQAMASAVMNNVTYGVTGVSSSSTTATLTFAPSPALAIPPYAVGQWITVANVTPTGYNGLYVVTACTTTTVSYTTTGSNLGSTSFAQYVGTITSGTVVGTTVVNPGTGYTAPPPVVFQDPVPTQFLQVWNTIAGGNAYMYGAVPQTIATTGASGTGALSVVTGTISAVASGTTVTVNTTTGYWPGEEFVVSGGNGSGGLYNGTWYVASILSGTTLTLATTLQNAQFNNPYTFTSASLTGTNFSANPSAAMAAGIATLTFSSLGTTIVPFYPGQTITVGNVTPLGYNGTYTVFTATNTSVSFYSSITGSQTVAGSIVSNAANCPTIYLKVPQYGSAQANEYYNYYQVTYPGILSTTPPSHVSGGALNGTAYLTYVGTLAQGITSIGYSGIITQGAVHQLGAVSQLIVSYVGSGYTTPPTVTIGRPDFPGGRQAQAVISALSSGTIIQTNIAITDPGSGYLNPPTVTLSTPNASIVPAVVTAVISNPGEKPIVSQMPVAASNAYFLDFGLYGNNVTTITTAASSTVYFDNIVNSGAAPYTHGFPQGRKVILYVRNTSGSTITITFSNLAAANTNKGSNAPTVSANTTMRCEFQVLTQSSYLNNAATPIASSAGGNANDVYAIFINS